MIEGNMKSTFWTKCPFCFTEIECIYICCPTCGRLFSTKKLQSNTQTQIKRLEEKFVEIEQKKCIGK